MKLLWFLAVPLSFAFQFANASPSFDQSSLIPALKLKQKHYYWGDTETTVSLDGIRIDNRGRMFYSLVAKSPSWDVIVFRDDDKTYLRQSLSDFESTGMVNNFVVEKRPRNFGFKKEETLVKFDGITVKQLVHGPHFYQYLPLGMVAAKQVERILYIAYKLPTNGGIPVMMRKYTKGTDWLTGIKDPGRHKALLETSKIENLRVSKSIFDAPLNYKLRGSMQEVLMSKTSRDASGDLEVLIGDKKQ